MEEFKDAGNKAYSEGSYQDAVDKYSSAIDAAPPDDSPSLSVLYSNRSASYFCMKQYDKALEDSNKVIDLSPTWAKGYSRKGATLMCLKRYEEAMKAFSQGLLHDPESEQLINGLKDADTALKEKSSKKRKLADILDDFDCVLCMKLLYEPITTPCGHSFCRSCILRALDHNNACPLCRTVLHMTPDHPISVVLQNIIQKNFVDEYNTRKKEFEEAPDDTSVMPLFLLNTVAFPGQSFPLHIFEPRYRLMIRRCLAGSKKFGLAIATTSHPTGEEVGCTLEIRDIRMLPDGRSFVDTIGGSRFKILDRWVEDGYMCGKTQPISDEVSEAGTKEAIEVAEKIQTEINEFVESASASEACNSMKRIVATLGEMPSKENPEKFSFWLASKLSAAFTPTKSFQLLNCTNTAERLNTMLELITQSECAVQ